MVPPTELGAHEADLAKSDQDELNEADAHEADTATFDGVVGAHEAEPAKSAQEELREEDAHEDEIDVEIDCVMKLINEKDAVSATDACVEYEELPTKEHESAQLAVIKHDEVSKTVLPKPSVRLLS